MYLVTAAQMRLIESKAIHEWQIPSLLLMENAAIRAAHHIKRLASENDRIVVVCGSGNNGGDGFAIARQLFTQGLGVQIVVVCDIAQLKGDALINYNLCKNLQIPFLAILDTPAEIVVDAVFGTGCRHPVSGVYAQAIHAINQYGQKVE